MITAKRRIYASLTAAIFTYCYLGCSSPSQTGVETVSESEQYFDSLSNQLINELIPANEQKEENQYVSYNQVHLFEPENSTEAEEAQAEMVTFGESMRIRKGGQLTRTETRKWQMIYLHLRKFFDIPAGNGRQVYQELMTNSEAYFSINIVDKMLEMDFRQPSMAQKLQSHNLDSLFEYLLGKKVYSTDALETVLRANGLNDLGAYFEQNFRGRIAWKEMGGDLFQSADSRYTDFWEYHLKPMRVRTLLLLANKSRKLVVGFTESRFHAIFSDEFAEVMMNNAGRFSSTIDYVEKCIGNLDTLVKTLFRLFPQAKTRFKELINNDPYKHFKFYDRDVYRGGEYMKNVTVRQFYQYINHHTFQRGVAAVGGGPGVLMAAYSASGYPVVAHEAMHWGDQFKYLIVTDDLDGDEENSFIGHAFRKHDGSTDLFQYYTNIGYDSEKKESNRYLNDHYDRFATLDDWHEFLARSGFNRYFVRYLRYLYEGTTINDMGKNTADLTHQDRLVWLIGNLGWGIDGQSKAQLDQSFLAYCRAAKGGADLVAQHEQGSLHIYGQSLTEHENSIFVSIDAIFNGGGKVYGLTLSEWNDLYAAMSKPLNILTALRQESDDHRYFYNNNLKSALQQNDYLANYF